MNPSTKIRVIEDMIITVGLLLFVAGCLPTRQMDEIKDIKNKVLLEDVKFQKAERKYYCGPEALSPILNYHGFDSTPEEIGEELMGRDEEGINIVELRLYAENRGLKAKIKKGSIKLLENAVDEKRPVILLVELTKKQDVGLFFGTVPVFRVNALYHFYAVVGYSENYVFVLGPRGRSGIRKKDLLSIWKPTKYATLELWPPDKK